MHHWLTHCHPSWDPCTGCPPCGPWGWPAPAWSGIAWSWVPIAWPPIGMPWASEDHPLRLPQELSVVKGGAAQEAVVGGREPVHLSLEYLVEAGAAAPAVTLTITSNGSTTTWSETAIAQGYHVKDDLPPVEPGGKLKLEVTDASARLRWVEAVCCH